MINGKNGGKYNINAMILCGLAFFRNSCHRFLYGGEQQGRCKGTCGDRGAEKGLRRKRRQLRKEQ